jgi:hypothetical protein
MISKLEYKMFMTSQAPVAHAYNPNYSGGRDQDGGLKPAWASSLQDSSSKKPFKKRDGGVAQYCKKKKFMMSLIICQMIRKCSKDGTF